MSEKTIVLRHHKIGDMGWIIYRQARLYNEEYQWDQGYEALVCEIAANFIKNFNLEKDCCYIAELNGVPVGSAFIVHTEDSEIAKFRLLFVEPDARGLGIAGQLVEACLSFSQKAGYKKVKLWTQSILLEARRIYKRAGFVLVEKEPHNSFGHDLIAETWEKVF